MRVNYAFSFKAFDTLQHPLVHLQLSPHVHFPSPGQP